MQCTLYLEFESLGLESIFKIKSWLKCSILIRWTSILHNIVIFGRQAKHIFDVIEFILTWLIWFLTYGLFKNLLVRVSGRRSPAPLSINILVFHFSDDFDSEVNSLLEMPHKRKVWNGVFCFVCIRVIYIHSEQEFGSIFNCKRKCLRVCLWFLTIQLVRFFRWQIIAWQIFKILKSKLNIGSQNQRHMVSVHGHRLKLKSISTQYNNKIL